LIVKSFFKRNIIIVLFVVLVNVAYCVNFAFADSYDGPSPNGERAYVDAKDGYANIRKGAGTKYDVIAKLDNGTEVRVFGDIKNKKGEKWYCIGDDNHYAKSRGVLKENCGWTHESNIKLGVKKNER